MAQNQIAHTHGFGTVSTLTPPLPVPLSLEAVTCSTAPLEKHELCDNKLRPPGSSHTWAAEVHVPSTVLVRLALLAKSVVL